MVFIQRNKTLCSHRNLYINFHHSFVCNSKTLKRGRCPPKDEWLDKLWSIQTTEYCSVIQRNGLLIHTTIWMYLQRIVLNGNSQSQKVAYCETPFISHFWNDNILELETGLFPGVRNERRGQTEGGGCCYRRAAQRVLAWEHCQCPNCVVDMWTFTCDKKYVNDICMDLWTHTIQVELGKSEQDQSSTPMSKYKLCYCATVSQNNIIAGKW